MSSYIFFDVRFRARADHFAIKWTGEQLGLPWHKAYHAPLYRGASAYCELFIKRLRYDEAIPYEVTKGFPCP